MKTIKIKLPNQQPDRCKDCVLVGIIPEVYRQRGVRQSYCCLGVFPHEALTSKGIEVSASDKQKTGHLLHRPCDDRWEAWMQEPNHVFHLSLESYKLCRLPYERRCQLAFKFK